MVVNEKQVLYRIDDEQLVIYNFVVVEEVNRIVVVEELLKTVDGTEMGCTEVDGCRMGVRADESLSYAYPLLTSHL
ncbi:hypothetical protein Tco_1235883 [Tanacetum coccineum]